MEIRELAVPHAWEITPVIHSDDRGEFLESFRADSLAEATGRSFELRQANTSISGRGVARGVHFADIHEDGGAQAKYVTVLAGSVIDFIVDIRVGSPTFGRWDSVELTDANRKAVFLSEGLGHLLVATSESATVNYLVNDVYRPTREHGISPIDPALGLALPLPVDQLVLSAQDVAAPTLAEAAAAGLLPSWDAALARYAELSIGAKA